MRVHYEIWKPTSSVFMNVLKTILNLRLISSSLQSAVFSLSDSSSDPYFLKYRLMKDWKILARRLVQFVDLFATKIMFLVLNFFLCYSFTICRWHTSVEWRLSGLTQYTDAVQICAFYWGLLSVDSVHVDPVLASYGSRLHCQRVGKHAAPIFTVQVSRFSKCSAEKAKVYILVGNHCCTIFTEIRMWWQIWMKIPSMNFHKSPPFHADGPIVRPV
jgi:hypothetical protein